MSGPRYGAARLARLGGHRRGASRTSALRRRSRGVVEPERRRRRTAAPGSGTASGSCIRTCAIVFEERDMADRTTASGGYFAGVDAGALRRRRTPPTRSRIAATTRTASCSAAAWRTGCAPPSASGTRSAGTAPTCSAPARSAVRGWPAPMTRDAAFAKMDAAFEFFARLGAAVLLLPRRRRDGRGGDAGRAHQATSPKPVDRLERKQAEVGVRPLWGTANLFCAPALPWPAPATNPDPDVVACAAAQVRQCLEATNGSAARTTCCWGGARATTRCSTPTFAASSSSIGPVPGAGRRSQAPHRPSRLRS